MSHIQAYNAAKTAGLKSPKSSLGWDKSDFLGRNTKQSCPAKVAISPKSKVSDPYVVYYHTACTVFWGRAWGMVAMLKYAGRPYFIKGAPEAPKEAGFAVPMVTFPEGLSKQGRVRVRDMYIFGWHSGYIWVAFVGTAFFFDILSSA